VFSPGAPVFPELAAVALPLLFEDKIIYPTAVTNASCIQFNRVMFFLKDIKNFSEHSKLQAINQPKCRS
jgi:hypothetical protein